METLKFKSTIKCTGCLANVTPFLNDTQGIETWEVDLKNPEKILTVNSTGATAEDITRAIGNAGYTAEQVK